MRRIAYQMALGSLGIVARLMSLRKPTIFCFHSVTPAGSGASSRSAMAVSAAYLERLIIDLRAHAIPIVPLAEAVTRIANGESDPFVVLTFDDGYRDNYENLFPLMVRLRAPFTIFVTTGLVDRDIPMWWESLDEIVAADTGPTKARSTDISAARARSLALTEQFRSRDPAGQCALLAEIAGTNSGTAERRAYEHALTWPMLREMRVSGLLTVGSHTQHHPMLGRLGGDQIRSELASSRQRIEQELDIAVDYVAYPYGQPWEVGPVAGEIAEELGFKAAFSTIARPLARGDDRELFNLPRILLSSKAQSSNIALGYMSGLPAKVKRMIRPDAVSLQ